MTYYMAWMIDDFLWPGECFDLPIDGGYWSVC